MKFPTGLKKYLSLSLHIETGDTITDLSILRIIFGSKKFID